MKKSELLNVLAGFEDDVELQILIAGEEPYEIVKADTDGQGIVFLVAATEAL